MGTMRDRRLRRMGRLMVAATIGALLVLVVVWAQDDATPPAQPPTGAAEGDASSAGPDAGETAGTGGEAATEEQEPVHVERADKVRFEPDPDDPENPDTGTYYLTGNVYMWHKDAHLYCDECVYNVGNDTGRALGNLRLVQPDTTVTGDLLEADFDKEVAVITGNVRLVTQKKKADEAGEPAADEEDAGAPEGPKPEGNDEGQKPAEAAGDAEDDKWAEYKEKRTVVTCEKLTYWYEEDRAIAIGNVVAVQEDKTVNADEAVYVGEEDKVTLKGNPVTFRRENGDQGQTTEAVIYIEEDRFETAGFSGVFRRRDKGKEDEQQPANGPAAQPTSDTTTQPQPETEPRVPE